MLANLTQFNGEYGCGHCEHPGSRARQGAGTVQIYELKHPLPDLRKETSMLHSAALALQAGKPVMGVKGPSLFYLIPTFDVARGFAPDIMHFLFLGIDNQFSNLWKGKRILYIPFLYCPVWFSNRQSY
jgi:hypothetical protein